MFALRVVCVSFLFMISCCCHVQYWHHQRFPLPAIYSQTWPVATLQTIVGAKGCLPIGRHKSAAVNCRVKTVKSTFTLDFNNQWRALQQRSKLHPRETADAGSS
ncbi:hypothetical protein JAAARDRAFT_359738 [Jaapia argillacea MUCL 33604]|uniref:Secreted protein n=1 Tax=Jaapia argillacea MUCL 33604 TaxID=933084 RepID=A0A067Q7C1_9AGAM|nr:hypothetical protein JAAARDRAFT_359738 [Jaapia argillacea MUCL 33604]